MEYKKGTFKPIDKFISFSGLFIIIELKIGSSCDNSLHGPIYYSIILK